MSAREANIRRIRKKLSGYIIVFLILSQVLFLDKKYLNKLLYKKEKYTFYMNTNKRALGDIGEDMAISYLENKGYNIIERNATFLGGELDIITQYDGLWRFVEVKYRETTMFGMPEDAMTPKKIRTLLRAIEFYCLKKHIDVVQVRLDFLGILKLSDGTYEYRLIQDVN